MPTSHNQTVDRERMVLIHSIINGTKFNVGQVIAQELSETCRTNRAIHSFPCLISALCRAAEVPTRQTDKYTPFKAGWTRKEYMRKIDLANVIPIQVVMSTSIASEQPKPFAPTATQPDLEEVQPTPQATPAASPARTSVATQMIRTAMRPPLNRPQRQKLHLQKKTPQQPPANAQTSPASRKGKALSGRILIEQRSPNPIAETGEQSTARPAKRHRRYHVITTDIDEEGINKHVTTKTEPAQDSALSPSFYLFVFNFPTLLSASSVHLLMIMH
ncbi:hypothetical protein GQ457_01G022310 [Hibiscus cannabinus]